MRDVISQVSNFKDLESIIQDDGKINENVTHRIQAGWLKWRKVLNFCDHKGPTKTQKQVLCTTICPIILYYSECWAFKGTWEKNMSNENVKMDVIIQEKIEYEMKFYKDWYNIHWKKYEKN